MKHLLLAFLVLITGLILCIESLYWLIAETRQPLPGSCDVLVLGSPSEADGSVDPIQRFRVETAVQIYRTHRCRQMILTGGAVRNEFVEAETMASEARSLGMRSSELIIERSARSTWENIGCTREWAGADRIFVVSNSLHARRAVRYACEQIPNHCKRYRPAGLTPPMELLWWRYTAVGYELSAFLRDLLYFASGLAQRPPFCAGTHS